MLKRKCFDFCHFLFQIGNHFFDRNVVVAYRWRFSKTQNSVYFHFNKQSWLMRFCSSTRYRERIMKGEISLFISDFHWGLTIKSSITKVFEIARRNWNSHGVVNTWMWIKNLIFGAGLNCLSERWLQPSVAMRVKFFTFEHAGKELIHHKWF